MHRTGRRDSRLYYTCVVDIYSGSVSEARYRVVGEAQVYVLQRVLHGWDNKSATTILENCRRAMDPGNRLLVIEALVGEPNKPSWANYLDLMMLTTSGGYERTKQEYQQLLNSAGFGVEQVIPTTSDYTIICGVAR